MFDWNGDGSHDSFDDYMDYRMSQGDDDFSSGDGRNCGIGNGSGSGCLSFLGFLFFLIVTALFN